MSPHRFRRPAGLVLTLAVMVGALAAPLPAAAGNGQLTTFNFELGNSCLYGTGWANTTLHVALKGAGGTFQGHFQVTTDSNGEWGYECFWGDIDAGDSIIATSGPTSRTYVVQPLSFAVNRVTDVVAGKSVPNSSVDIFVMECQTEWSSCNSEQDVARSTNGNGAFSNDFTSHYDIRGGDYVQVQWFDGLGDAQRRSLNAPQLGTWLGNNQAWGVAKPNADVSVWLFDANGNQRAKFNDRADVDYGEFGSKWVRNGRAVDVQMGDYVGSNIAGDALFKVINFKPTFDPGSDVITAKCWKNAAFDLFAEHSNGNDLMDYQGQTDGNGNLSVNTQNTNTYDLQADDTVDLRCRNSAGDELQGDIRGSVKWATWEL